MSITEQESVGIGRQFRERSNFIEHDAARAQDCTQFKIKRPISANDDHMQATVVTADRHRSGMFGQPAADDIAHRAVVSSNAAEVPIKLAGNKQRFDDFLDRPRYMDAFALDMRSQRGRDSGWRRNEAESQRGAHCLCECA